MVRRLSAVLVLASLCSAQAVWTKRSTQPRPTAGVGAPVAYDEKNGNTVWFGVPNVDETWLWDGVAWRLAATGGPNAKGYGQMVYDRAAGRVLLVGTNGGVIDTWSWDGVRWTKLLPSTAPPRRTLFSLAYDARRKATVLFGGSDGDARSDTWEFDGTTWRQRSSGGPPARQLANLAFDDVRGEVVLFGGERDQTPRVRFGDTWIWDGQVWREHFNIPGPGARVYSAMCFDRRRGRVVLSGGTDRVSTYFDDTWEWDGKAWTQINPTSSPPRNLYGSMVFDTARGVSVLLLGDLLGSETWEYTNRALPRATYTDFGTGCPSSVGAPVLAAGAGQLPRLGQTFSLGLSNLPGGAFVRAFGVVGASDTTWQGLNLPFDLAQIGMPGCRLLVSMDIILPLAITNQQAPWSFAIPNDPTLAGGQFFLQGLVFEPGANAVGAVVSNGGAGKAGM